MINVSHIIRPSFKMWWYVFVSLKTSFSSHLRSGYRIHTNPEFTKYQNNTFLLWLMILLFKYDMLVISSILINGQTERGKVENWQRRMSAKKRLEESKNATDFICYVHNTIRKQVQEYRAHRLQLNGLCAEHKYTYIS